MSATIVQRARPGWGFWFLWMVATALGAIAGAVLSLPLNLVIVALQVGTLEIPWYITEKALILTSDTTLSTMVLLGLGMGFGQWLLLRRHLSHVRSWILATGLALFLAGVIRWGVLANGPLELIGPVSALAVTIFIGVCQWFVLRAHVPHAERWIAFMVAGSLFTLAIGAAMEFAQFSLDSFLGMLIMVVGAGLVPFGVASAGMVWLLRQAPLANRAAPA